MMNKLFKILMSVAVSAILVSFTFISSNNSMEEDELTLGYSENVEAILKNSCFDCHTNGSKSEKAIEKLNFSKWKDYDVTKKVGTFDKITEVLKKGEMPKEKYLQYYPDKALSKEQVDLLVNWANNEADNLLK